jgi:hypothetical protein
MGEVQRIVYVQPGLPPPKDKDDSLPNGHDPVRRLGIRWNSCFVRRATLHYPRPTSTDEALVDYVDQQDGIETRAPGSHVHNDDYVGIASYNIFVGIAVATIFGSGFFFDLFWPERKESYSVKWAWKISSVVVSFMALADAIAMTVCHLTLGR